MLRMQDDGILTLPPPRTANANGKLNALPLRRLRHSSFAPDEGHAPVQ